MKVERDFRKCLVQPPAQSCASYGSGQGVWGLTHSHYENLQGWRLHPSGQPAPLLDCLCKKSELLLFQFVTIISCNSAMEPYEEAGCLLYDLLLGAGCCCSVLLKLSLLQSEEAQLPQPLLSGHMLQPHTKLASV